MWGFWPLAWGAGLWSAQDLGAEVQRRARLGGRSRDARTEGRGSNASGLGGFTSVR